MPFLCHTSGLGVTAVHDRAWFCLQGKKALSKKANSGALVNAAFKKGERDPKSGALLVEL